MIPKLVIFDCDGVLIDSEPVTEQLMSDSFANYGLQISPHKVGALFTGGTMKTAADEARKLGANLPDDWVNDINKAVADILAKGVPIFDGLFDLLDALETANIATAIASNGPMSKMKASLTPSGLWNKFNGRIYSGHDYAPKPAPDMLLNAIEKAGTTSAETIFIDDSPTGCRAGIAASVRVYGFRPIGDTGDLEKVGAIPKRSMQDIQMSIFSDSVSFE